MPLEVVWRLIAHVLSPSLAIVLDDASELNNCRVTVWGILISGGISGDIFGQVVIRLQREQCPSHVDIFCTPRLAAPDRAGRRLPLLPPRNAGV